MRDAAADPAPYRLVIELPGLPHLQSGTWSHWSKRRQHDTQWREAVGWAARKAGLPRVLLAQAHVEFVRFSARIPDSDNNVGSFKPLVDGLIGSVLLDDSPAHITCEYHWSKAPPHKGKVRIIVEARG